MQTLTGAQKLCMFWNILSHVRDDGGVETSVKPKTIGVPLSGRHHRRDRRRTLRSALLTRLEQKPRPPGAVEVLLYFYGAFLPIQTWQNQETPAQLSQNCCQISEPQCLYHQLFLKCIISSRKDLTCCRCLAPPRWFAASLVCRVLSLSGYSCVTRREEPVVCRVVGDSCTPVGMLQLVASDSNGTHRETEIEVRNWDKKHTIEFDWNIFRPGLSLKPSFFVHVPRSLRQYQTKSNFLMMKILDCKA